jgi:hypothetical protein
MKYLKFIFLILVVITPEMFSQGKISGIVYMDYFYNAARDTGIANIPNKVLSGPKDLNGFDFRRIYLTYDYKISETFNTRFRLEGDGRTLSKNDRFSMFIKDAFIRWKNILPGHDVIVGIQPTPAFEVSESVYGFRSLEKTIMDLRSIVSSREFGLSVRGKVVNNLGYWFQFGNNAGSSPESDKYKRLYAHLSYKPLDKFVTTVYSDIRFRGKVNNYEAGPVSNNVITSAVFLGYTDPNKLNFGTEIFYQTAQNELVSLSSREDNNALGISVFGNVFLSDQISVTARYDLFNPSLDTDNKSDKRDLYILGLSYRPVPEVSIIPNFFIESYESAGGRNIESSITPRITISYEFF